MKKVLLLENIDKAACVAFEKAGFSVTAAAHALSELELLAQLQDVSILGIRSKTQITKQVLHAAPKLEAIGAFCIGTDQIDLLSCSQNDVAVFNAPYSNTRSVAELVIGECIMLLRHIFPKSTAMHQGQWSKTSKGSFEIREKKIGIVGYGSIGMQVGVLAEMLGMQVYYFDLREKLSVGNAQATASLEELLSLVDIVTIHVDGRGENKNIIGEKEFRQMKKGVFFLNLSRGHVVDYNALADAIKEGKVAGAAVDVYEQEPTHNGAFRTVLQNLPTVILTPHIAGSTQEAQEDIGKFVSQRLLKYSLEGNTDLAVIKAKRRGV